MGGVEYCAGLGLAIVGKPWSPGSFKLPPF
jgi:hypothetical protein